MGMGRNIVKVVLLGILVAGGWLGVILYDRGTRDPRLLEAQQKQREAEAMVEMLREIVQHLTSERRVADVLVSDQSTVDGKLRTTLLFYEYARDGSLLPPKRFVIDGNEAHVDALLIKFQGKYVQDKDPLRGRSVA